MSEGSSLQNFSGGKEYVSEHYCFDMVLAKDPWQSSVFTSMQIISLQIEGDQEDLSIPVIACEVRELWTIQQECQYWRYISLDTANGLLS